MVREEDASWSNPKVLVIFAVIFLCGVTFGAVATSSFLHRRIPVPEVHGTVAIEGARRFGLGRLKEELGLTPAQEKTIMRELDEYTKYYQNIEEQQQDVAEHGKRRILDVLDDQQKKRFNEIFDPKAH